MGRNNRQQDADEMQEAPATNEPTTAIDAAPDGVEREQELEGKDQQAESDSSDEIENGLVDALSPARCGHAGCPNFATHLVHRRKNKYETGSLVVEDFDTKNCMQHIGPASTYENYELLK
jgi:hypothetical protein